MESAGEREERGREEEEEKEEERTTAKKRRIIGRCVTMIHKRRGREREKN